MNERELPPTWAADELWNLTATAILGHSAVVEGEGVSLAALPGERSNREEGVKRLRGSMEEEGAPTVSPTSIRAGAYEKVGQASRGVVVNQYQSL